MSLLNVKLKADDVRKVQALRREGVVISDVVRAAIDHEYQRRIVRRAARKTPSALVAAIYASLPDPADLEPRTTDVHVGRAARRAVRAALARRRPT